MPDLSPMLSVGAEAGASMANASEHPAKRSVCCMTEY